MPGNTFPKGHVLHREGPAPQVVQHSGVRGQGEGQLIGVQGLTGLLIAAVHIAPSILSVSQQVQMIIQLTLTLSG